MGSESALSMGLRAGSGSKRNSVMGERVVVRPTLTDQPCLDRSVCLGRALYDLGSTRQWSPWRGGRVVECGALEKRCASDWRTGSSNLPPSVSTPAARHKKHLPSGLSWHRGYLQSARGRGASTNPRAILDADIIYSRVLHELVWGTLRTTCARWTTANGAL